MKKLAMVLLTTFISQIVYATKESPQPDVKTALQKIMHPDDTTTSHETQKIQRLVIWLTAQKIQNNMSMSNDKYPINKTK